MIEGISIDCDEDGFHLVMQGDFSDALEQWEKNPDCVLDLRLPQNEAIELLREVLDKIQPWHAEGESVRKDYERYQATGEVPDYLNEETVAMMEEKRLHSEDLDPAISGSYEMFSLSGNLAVAKALAPYLADLREQRQRGFVPTAAVLDDLLAKVQREVGSSYPEVYDTAVRETIWSALNSERQPVV